MIVDDTKSKGSSSGIPRSDRVAYYIVVVVHPSLLLPRRVIESYEERALPKTRCARQSGIDRAQVRRAHTDWHLGTNGTMLTRNLITESEYHNDSGVSTLANDQRQSCGVSPLALDDLEPTYRIQAFGKKGLAPDAGQHHSRRALRVVGSNQPWCWAG